MYFCFCTIVDCFRLLSTCFEGLQTVTYYLCIEIILILSLVEMCMTMVLFCVHVLMSFQSSKKSFFCFSYSHSYSVVHHTGFCFCFLLQEGDIFNNNIVYFIDSQVYGDDIYIYIYDNSFKSFLAILWLTTCKEEYTFWYTWTSKHLLHKLCIVTKTQ